MDFGQRTLSESYLMNQEAQPYRVKGNLVLLLNHQEALIWYD